MSAVPNATYMSRPTTKHRCLGSAVTNCPVLRVAEQVSSLLVTQVQRSSMVLLDIGVCGQEGISVKLLAYMHVLHHKQ